MKTLPIMDGESVILPPVAVDPQTAEALEIIARREYMTPGQLHRQALLCWTTAYMRQAYGTSDPGPQ